MIYDGGKIGQYSTGVDCGVRVRGGGDPHV